MNYEMYSIYDRVTGVFDFPVAFVNREDAIRRVAQACSKHPFPDDLELYMLGSFDSLVGEFVPLNKPEFVGSIKSFLVVTDNA